MKKYISGVIQAISSMVLVVLLVYLIDREIIYLNQYFSLALVLISFAFTITGIVKFLNNLPSGDEQ